MDAKRIAVALVAFCIGAVACGTAASSREPVGDAGTIPPGCDGGCGELTGAKGFTVKNALMSGITTQPSGEAHDVVFDMNDVPCSCAAAAAVSCPAAHRRMIVDIQRPIDVTDFSGTYTTDADAANTGVFVELLTYAEDGGIAEVEYLAPGAPGRFDVAIDDAGAKVTFTSTVAADEGGAPSALGGSFSAVRCASAFVPLTGP